MNKQDRKELMRAIGLIEEAKEIVANIMESEQEKFDNLSEGLQQTERGQKFEENVSNLESVDGSLCEAIDNIEYSME